MTGNSFLSPDFNKFVSLIAFGLVISNVSQLT